MQPLQTPTTQARFTNSIVLIEGLKALTMMGQRTTKARNILEDKKHTVPKSQRSELVF